MKQVTQWFYGDLKPARKGVYERYLYSDGYFIFSYWDGKKWGIGGRSANCACSLRCTTSHYQDCVWRGLAEKP